MNGIILMAAGESKRFGSAKQLVEFGGKTLLRHAAETAVDAGLGPVVVVLGAVDQPCRNSLAGMEVNIIHNPNWRQGMASSLVAALRSWEGTPLEGVIMLLADQPGVTPEHLRVLVEASPGKPIVASSYDGRLGVPAWFSQTKFPDLLNLHGESGAREVIRRESRSHSVEAPLAAFDIDTPEDFARICKALSSPGPRSHGVMRVPHDRELKQRHRVPISAMVDRRTRENPPTRRKEHE